MEPLAAAKMKATTTVTIFIIISLIAVGWSTVEVNAAEDERSPGVELGVGVAEQQRKLELERIAKLAAIRQKEAEEQAKKDPIEYQKQVLVEDWQRNQYQLDYAAVQIQNAEYEERLRREQQCCGLRGRLQRQACCVLMSRNSQPPQSKMGDIWITVGLSTVFLFLMVLTLRVFRNLEGQRKSCRKTHPVPIDDLGGVTNLHG